MGAVAARARVAGRARSSGRSPATATSTSPRGAQDRYLPALGRSLAQLPGTVYLRYAHEMNGYWYPWSRDARAYVRAWRRIVRIFRDAGARNVRFVWSVNPNLYEPPDEWLRNMRRYWPGSRYVDAVGSTMIDFGGLKAYRVARIHAAAADACTRRIRKPVVLTETNTAYAGRVRWLADFRRMLAQAQWIRAVVWSQLPSRGKAQRGNQVGETNWDVTEDPASAAVLRRIVQDGSG